MLGDKNSQLNLQSSALFSRIRFVLFGFNPPHHEQVKSKLVSVGGVDVGDYKPDCTHVIVHNMVHIHNGKIGDLLYPLQRNLQAPVNFVCLHCVKPSLRPLSMAMSTVLIHILGDVPSSPLFGVLQDHIQNWRHTALILTSILFLAAAIWFMGIFLHSKEKFYEEDEHKIIDQVDTGNQTPSLENKTDTT